MTNNILIKLHRVALYLITMLSFKWYNSVVSIFLATKRKMALRANNYAGVYWQAIRLNRT